MSYGSELNYAGMRTAFLLRRRVRWWPFAPAWSKSCEQKPGVYIIFAGNTPLYVGQSENVRRRIHGYRIENVSGLDDMTDGHTVTPWGNFRWREGKLRGKVCYPPRFGEHLMVEARLIRRLRPMFNIRGMRA